MRGTFALSDWAFSRWLPQVAAEYESGLLTKRLDNWLSSVFNGGLGLAFGRLYRKYGIQYAMLGHAGAHVISKLIWLVLI